MAKTEPSRYHLEVHRIYDHDFDAGSSDDVYRVLVDRLWPRGVKKADAALDLWAKDAAPSSDLRRWYGHDPGLFDEFARRYRAELSEGTPAAAVEELRQLARQHHVIFLTATKDMDHSGAVVLADFVSGAT